MEGKTKIIATLGPSCSSKEIIEGMLLHGVDVFRLNFSHDTYYEHKKRLQLTRKVAHRFGKHIAIIQDLCGPKIRLGEIEEVIIKTGEQIILGEKGLPITIPHILADLKKGDLVYIDDGKVVLFVIESDGQSASCQVTRGGFIASHKGVNIRAGLSSLKSLTDKDLEDLDFAINEGIDYVALSFVRSEDDIINLRKELEKRGKNIPIIAKIEKAEALKKLSNIIDSSDAIMIARGDLGIEATLEEVPIAQREIISKSRAKGKPVIVATQIMESMINNPYPTRAEVNDIATAILQGADAILFSAETAVGKYPVEVIKTVNQVCLRTEEELIKDEGINFSLREVNNLDVVSAISFSASKLATNLIVKGIIVPTETGRTAKMVSRFRPLPKIIALTTKKSIAQELCLVWGVIPLIMPEATSVEDMYQQAEKLILEKGLLESGDAVIFTSGSMIGLSGSTNTIKYHILRKYN